MARVIGKPEASWGSTSNVTDPKYDEWLNGEIWILKRGEDFAVSPTSFSGTIRAVALRRRGRCRTKVLDDARIQVQFYES